MVRKILPYLGDFAIILFTMVVMKRALRAFSHEMETTTFVIMTAGLTLSRVLQRRRQEKE